MDRHLIDRWTDTTTFGVALAFAVALALPVLALGIIVSVAMIGVAIFEQRIGPFGPVVVVLSVGGVIGVVGWARARQGSSRPEGHNVTATLVCLVVGTATALAVGAFAATPMVGGLREPWGPAAVAWTAAAAWPAALFVAAHAVWVLAGIGWMQRLMRRHAEHTGRAFDGIPVVLLFVAMGLGAAAALLTLTL
jgi:hypothetical protein